ILGAISATRSMVATNTNLGIVLLLAPLANVPRDVSLREGIQPVLEALDADDCRLVYEAIRLAQPGGMGEQPEADIHASPPSSLIEAMRLAEDRDSIARQYVNGFADVLDHVAPLIAEGLSQGWPLGDTIVHAYVQLLARMPDSLVARKCGVEMAQ